MEKNATADNFLGNSPFIMHTLLAVVLALAIGVAGNYRCPRVDSLAGGQYYS